MSSIEGLLGQLLAIVGGVAAVGGGLYAVIYLAFKTFAGKWLEHKFAQNLEAFRHRQQQEMEQLRFQINAQLDRLTKLHQHEFEALPSAWALMVDSYYKAAALTSPLQTYPDLDRMSTEQVDQFVTECPLLEWQKEELRHTSGKTSYYSKAIFWNRLNDARRVSLEARNFIAKSGIFIQRSIVEKMEKLDDMVFSALTEKEFNEAHGIIPFKLTDQEALHKEGKVLLKELEELVHERIWAPA
jgi:hypothetical protein